VKALVKEAVRRNRPWDVFRFAAHLPSFVRLFLALLGDRRVPAGAKALFLAGAVYAVTPLDFLPDLMPVMGQVDDLAIFGMACRFFIGLCPPDVVDEHVARIDRSGRWMPFGR
jgi:uncharacterized membrane protein YkvA (DUF1232 family)